MATKPSDRPIYTDEQLEQYFRYIKLPEADLQTKSTLQSQDAEAQLSFLAKLIRYQLAAIPFENLDLHYSPVKGISLDADHLFHKYVGRNAGRGGYCMQNNGFFGIILRSLGYTVMTTGGRVSKAMDEGSASKNEEGDFGGFGHQVNIVYIGGNKYAVDVGFGSTGPTFPIPLVEGYTWVNTGSTEQVGTSMKLTRGYAANNTSRNSEQELWVYHIKYTRADDDSHPWIPCYCFTETEFFPADFNVMSYYVSTSRSSIFVQMIMVTKFLMSDDGESLIGDITLANGSIKERRFGESKKLMDFESDEDRVEALEKYLGIKLSKSEIDGIRGFPSEVRTSPKS